MKFEANQELADYLIKNGYEENSHVDYPDNKGKRTFCLFRTPRKKRTSAMMSIKFNYLRIEPFYGYRLLEKAISNYSGCSITKQELDKLIEFQKRKRHSSAQIRNYS